MSNYFLTRKQQLTRLLHKYQSEVNSLPEGTLVIYQNGAKWYLQEKDKSGKTKRTYISKSKIDYASQLAKKALLKNYIRDIENEITAINAYIRVRKHCRLNNILAADSPYVPLLSDQYQWLSDHDYISNPNHPEALIIKAPKGQFVRSKSEAIIAYALFDHHLSYMYEHALLLGEYTIYPDFTIRHPVTNKLYIWEHFGLADQAKYQNAMCNKIRSYINAGYVPGDNLILTYETADCPLDISYVQGIIDLHFGADII
ncbi:hypothetical protein [Butyrivibrio sp. FC2001]|uniref:hypothetical protein n=1 Tax=Butyrivibrio sp. FC2001 TaxID=1280671 RepID=UPI0004111CF3|nr:hypothetical protein [Butyrivibrio sp. FC2001]